MLDRIASEQILKQLGSASSTMLVVKDLEHRFLYANNAFLDYLGLSSEEVLGRNDLEIGRSPTLVMGDESSGWPGMWALDAAAIEAEKAVETRDPGCRLGLQDARKHVLRVPLITDDGNVVALMVQIRDVSEEQELKEQFKMNLNALNAMDADIDTLDTVMAALIACRDTTSLAQLIVDSAMERTTADSAILSMLHESEELMDCIAWSGNYTEERVRTKVSRNTGICGRAWSEGRTICCDDANESGSLYKFSKPTQVCALPLTFDQKVHGLLTVTSSDPTVDLKHSVPLLERLVSLGSIALANTRLMESTEKALASMRTLAAISRDLMTVKDRTGACDTVCRMLVSALDITFASSYLLDEQGRLKPQVTWGRVDSDVRQLETIDNELIDEGIPKWVVEHGEYASISRLAADPRESSRVHALRDRRNIGSTVCLPIYDRGVVIGAMLVARDRSRCDLEDRETGLLRTIVNQLSTALERHFLSAELHHQAYHDSLTGLPNRRSLENELEQAISDSRLSGVACAVLFLDLDGFKAVNDSHGHAVGDRLLVSVAERLRSRLKSCDLLARLGGDEFAVILRDIAGPECAFAVGNRLVESLQEQFLVDGIRIGIGTSVGISCFPNDGCSADDLVSHADMAMYQSKHGDGGSILCFNEELATQSRRRSQTERDLRDGLANDEFRLVYQPQVNCDGSGVACVEALIRWNHPVRGTVSPAEFIPVAESSGLIDDIGAWVIGEASRQLGEWSRGPLSELRISVNIGASQFQQIDFVDQITDALHNHGASPAMLELEVTESVVMRDLDSVIKRLRVLRNMGVRIAIDDFGTGYSSLSYLQDLPLDVLKIDRAFVSRLSESGDEHSLVNTIQLLASGLDLATVAEGVETTGQRDAVIRMGCNVIQGYLYSKPVAANEVAGAVRALFRLLENDPMKPGKPQRRA